MGAIQLLVWGAVAAAEAGMMAAVDGTASSAVGEVGAAGAMAQAMMVAVVAGAVVAVEDGGCQMYCPRPSRIH